MRIPGSMVGNMVSLILVWTLVCPNSASLLKAVTDARSVPESTSSSISSLSTSTTTAQSQEAPAETDSVPVSQCGAVKFHLVQVGAGLAPMLWASSPSFGPKAQPMIISMFGDSDLVRFGAAYETRFQNGAFYAVPEFRLLGPPRLSSVTIIDAFEKKCFFGGVASHQYRANHGRRARTDQSDAGLLPLSRYSPLAIQAGAFSFTANVETGARTMYLGDDEQERPVPGSKAIACEYSYTPMLSSDHYIVRGGLNGVLNANVLFATELGGPAISVSPALLGFFTIDSPTIELTIAGMNLRFRKYKILDDNSHGMMTIILNPLMLGSLSIKFDIANNRIGFKRCYA